MKLENKNNLFNDIKELLNKARNQVIKTVNSTMVITYFEIGRIIVEHEQKGNIKAEYGAEILSNLSKQLTQEFGKGYTKRNLELMRQFYIIYGKTKTVFSQSEISKGLILSWSHYIRLMRLDNNSERIFYETETRNNNWSVRELDRQINSALFERIALSKDKKGVLQENIKKYHDPQHPKDIIKDPYILEFLNLSEQNKYSENNLETAIIDNLQKFLLELGKGFSFVARQKRFSFGTEHFYLDLVFYNRLLKCFVIIDLKVDKLTHQDIGQMQMYVNMYDRFVKKEWENPTIGLILCKEQNHIVVEYTLPKDSNIFASEYKLYLPTKEELQKQLEDVEVNLSDTKQGEQNL
ncbi:MAG: PDDEXK nuclease domain-containing protein [Candidatus Margulisiibacteriota bacterium]|jgi:predicted nuclease of restriction endonuclease-like (RecB) superfamily